MVYHLNFYYFLCLSLLTIFANAKQYKVTKQVYFEVSHGDEPLGRITIGLFGSVVPKTVKNFLIIATNGINGKTYRGTQFHRVVPRFMIQGGDIERDDGTGSISIYGKYFKDENFKINHTGPGFISMANSGENTNGCQFFITTIATPWLDGHHTVFGKIVDGQDIVHKIEHVKRDIDDHPITPVIITSSGRISTPTPFFVSDDPYDLWAWVKASVVPFTMSFSILAFFHWIIKRLDDTNNKLEKIEKELKTE